ncbi:unnamed protein product, partial [Durusdinium trenchii]
FPQCDKVEILQGHFGGITPKPTTLFIINGAQDNAGLLHSLRTTSLPKEAALGRDEAGNWKTAALKEYPSGLCNALCCIVEEGQAMHGQEATDDIPVAFLETIGELTKDFDYSAERGLDFHV